MPFEEVMQTNPYKYTGLVYQNYLCYFEKQKLKEDIEKYMK